ncbi:MAG: T9SS type A sorting domain-containing protein [Bacteroidota bacterium]
MNRIYLFILLSCSGLEGYCQISNISRPDTTIDIESKCNFLSDVYISSKPDIKYYPNPAADQLIISVQDGFCDNISVRIICMAGQILISEDMQGASKYMIDISRLPEGNYIIELNDSTLFLRDKLIIN